MTGVTHDIVLRGARVIDPESGLDGLRDVAVDGGAIARVELPGAVADGRVDLDLRGQVVAPGFIDLHSHSLELAGLWLRVSDGVTTALELEAGALPVAKAYAQMAERGSPIHYGFSASWALARREAFGGKGDPGLTGLLGDVFWQRPGSAAERLVMIDAIERELAEGALGIGILLGYCPEADASEYAQVAALAADRQVPTFTHVRELDRIDAGLMGAQELVAAAVATGAHMHLCHVNSTSVRHLDDVTALLDSARAQGLRITTEAYPYGAGATAIGASFLAPGALSTLGIEPSDICYLATGERPATLARLADLRAQDPGGMAVIDFLHEDSADDLAILTRSLLSSDAAVASDAMPLVFRGQSGGKADEDSWPVRPDCVTHPRTAGTFARVLRWYVRELEVMSLPEAIRRSTLVPARVLESSVPAMRRKARVQVGADADLVVLDPDKVTDRATFDDPCRVSAGIPHVIVDGHFVIRDGLLDTSARPGRPIRTG